MTRTKRNPHRGRPELRIEMGELGTVDPFRLDLIENPAGSVDTEQSMADDIDLNTGDPDFWKKEQEFKDTQQAEKLQNKRNKNKEFHDHDGT